MQGLSLSWALLLAATLAWMTVSDDTSTNICIWEQFRAAVVQNRLYIDGGQMFKNYGRPGAWSTTTDPWPDFGNGIYYLDFSTKFDTSSDNLTELFLQTPEAGLLSYYDGFMFADDFEMFTFGGLANPSVTGYPLPEYISGYQFFEEDPTVSIFHPGPDTSSVYLNNGVTRYITSGAGANAPSEKKGFYFSGLTNSNRTLYDAGTAQDLVSSMVVADMSAFGSPTFNAVSLSGSGDTIMPRAGAELVWIPVGSHGVLIAIGGVPYLEESFASALNPTQQHNDTFAGTAFMKSLAVFDIAGGKWYLQDITGTDAPLALAQFCSVMVSEKGPGSSSFEIFIYGGYNGQAGAGISYGEPSGDVWILSVPSFTWIQVPGDSSMGRYRHYCATPYPDQMLVVGGAGYEGTCLNASVIQIFDLNGLTWKTTYDPNVYSKYQTPGKVASAISPQPTANWTNPALGQVWGTKYTGNITNFYPYTSPSPHHSKWLVPVVATIAALVGLIFVAVIILYCRRHSKKKRRSATSETQPNSAISRWRDGIPKTESSIATTEVEESGSPGLGGYYEVDGDYKYRQASAPQVGFAEVSVGTRRISQPSSISPRSPRSARLPASVEAGSVEVHGEQRYEMQSMEPRIMLKGQTPTNYHFRDHPLYPRSINDLDRAASQSQASHQPTPSYGSPSSAGGAPSPILPAQKTNESENISRGAPEQTSPELPASPVERRPPHTRNVSSLSSVLPLISPSVDEDNPDIDQIAKHSGLGFDTSSSRPRHKRNISSMSSGFTQLPSPDEETTARPQEDTRHSEDLAALGMPEVNTPTQELTERRPLMAPDYAGEQPTSPRDSKNLLTRKPVGRPVVLEEFATFEEGRQTV